MVAELDALAGRVGELPVGRRAQARFFVAVRRAEVRLRQGRLEDAARLCAAARDAARAEGVWKGSYRALLLVLFEQCAGEDAIAALLADEGGYVESAEAEADAAPLGLGVPLALLRAEVALRSGRDADAVRRFGEAADRALAELPRDDPRRVTALGRIGWELVVRGDLDRAEIYLKELPPDLARYPRGMLALRRGDFELALRAGRALERSGRVVSGLQLEGEALERSGQPAAAGVVYRRLLELARDPLDRAIALRSIADTELALARPGEDARLAAAERLYRQALEAASGSGRHGEAEGVQILANLGAALEQLGRRDEARASFAASLVRVDAARRTVAIDPFGGSFLREAHLRAIEGLLRLWPADADAADALAVVEVGKARTLLDWTREPPRAAGAVARAVRNLVLSADPDALDARLRELEDARRDGGAVTVSAASPLRAPALRASLAAEAGTVFVSYWLGEARLYAVTGRGVLDLAAATDATEALARARTAVLDPTRRPDDALRAAAAVFLPAALCAELLGARRVVLCPDERLGRVPFEALPVRGEPLGLAFAVERAPSLSVRAVLASRARLDATRVVVVSEVLAADAERELGLDPLAFSERERELVERAYGASNVVSLRGPAATRDRLRRALTTGDVDLVHVSAHAVEDRRLPTASVLVLADGPVALPSLCDAALGGAFVVLSSCSSGTGEERGGEGDLGLLGWPVAAGARGAIASLWPVSAQATADLMGQFHAFRAAGVDEAEALREARRVLAGSPQYAHPYFWAGFAAFAPGRPVRTSGWAWALSGLFACGAVVVLGLRRRRRQSHGRS